MRSGGTTAQIRRSIRVGGRRLELEDVLVPVLIPQAKPGQLPESVGEHRPPRYSVITLSAHSTSETKMAGLPNFAPQFARSASVTPRAREQAPHA